MRRLGLLAIAIGLMLIAVACAAPGLGIELTSSIALAPASAELGTPIVNARVNMDTINQPRGGSMVFILQYRNPGSLRWNFAGRLVVNSFPPPGSPGTVAIRYPCLRGARYRFQVTWDGVTENGTDSAGRGYLPSRFGKPVNCRPRAPGH